MAESFDSASLSGGSRLLSQSPQFSFNNNNSASSSSSHAHTGLGGEDLSLSDLDLEPRHLHNPKSQARPSIAQALGFGAPLDKSAEDLSVLGALEEKEDAGEWEEEQSAEAEAEADVTVRVGGAENMVIAAQSREEKLQSDLIVLRQLNGSFAVYNDAIREARAGTEVSQVFHAFHARIYFFSFLLASRRETGTDRRTAQQIHQYFKKVGEVLAAHIRRAMDGRRGGMRVIPFLHL